MLHIEIKTILHNKQLYNTVGCHFEKEGDGFITVSDLGNWKYEILVAIHEFVEQSLCLAHGITTEKMIAFDKQFDKFRTEEKPLEPGNDPAAPYHKEHIVATSFEKIMAKELEIDWNEYNQYIDKVYSKAIHDKLF